MEEYGSDSDGTCMAMANPLCGMICPDKLQRI